MIPLFYYLLEEVTLWLRNPHQKERETAHGRRIRRKMLKEPLCHGPDLNPRPQSPEPSALSTRPWHLARQTKLKWHLGQVLGSMLDF